MEIFSIIQLMQFNHNLLNMTKTLYRHMDQNDNVLNIQVYCNFILFIYFLNMFLQGLVHNSFYSEIEDIGLIQRLSVLLHIFR